MFIFGSDYRVRVRQYSADRVKVLQGGPLVQQVLRLRSMELHV